MENLLLDARYAFRVLRKSPAFTIVAALTLMLGIGANVVVFGVLNAVLGQGLDVRDASSLYQLRHQQWTMGKLITTSYPAFEDLRQRNTTFSGMAAINAYSHVDLRWGNAVRGVSGEEVTGNYFDLLGVTPQRGRFFHEAEEHGPNSAPYIVLSDGLWRSSFGADPAVIGTTVQLNKYSFTVAGVAPARFHGTERFAWPDYWIPMANEQQVENADYLHDRAHVAVTVIGRVKPGVSIRQATDDLNAISAELAREYPSTDDGGRLRLIHPGLVGDESDVIRGFLYSVSLLALLVLAAACANLASLFASRVADRGRELAVRMALGSSRQRLSMQLMTEAVLIALMAGAAGLAAANLLLTALNRWQPAADAHLAANIDARVFLGGAALTLTSALLFGMVPAWRAWHGSPLQIIKGETAAAPGLRRFAFRDWMLGAQIAICTMLVAASLVALRGMERALDAPLGFQPKGAMLAEIDLKREDAGDAAEQAQAILHVIRAIPGVTAAGTTSRTPFTGGLHGVPIFPPGTTELKLKNSILAPYVFAISPGYMEAAGTRLLAGRDVSLQDGAKSPHVAVVNQTLAQKVWGQTAATGQHFIVSGNLTEVVGVVENGKYHDLQEAPQPAVYVPLSQREDSDAIFVVRSLRTPREMTAELRGVLIRSAPNAMITVQNWSDTVDDALFPARAATASLGVMGLMAAMLAVTGIFGTAAYGVSRRMKELGIRAALGARKAQVLRAALKRPLIVLGAGSAIGLLAAMAAGSLLRQIVYQANPNDAVVLGGTAVTMALIGLIAAALPARRAMQVDPSRLISEE